MPCGDSGQPISFPTVGCSSPPPSLNDEDLDLPPPPPPPSAYLPLPEEEPPVLPGTSLISDLEQLHLPPPPPPPLLQVQECPQGSPTRSVSGGRGWGPFPALPRWRCFGSFRLKSVCLQSPSEFQSWWKLEFSEFLVRHVPQPLCSLCSRTRPGSDPNLYTA